MSPATTTITPVTSPANSGLVVGNVPLVAGTAEPARRGECGVYVKGKWYTLSLDGGHATDTALAGTAEPTADLADQVAAWLDRHLLS